MRALVLERPRQFKMVDKPLPDVRDDEVLIRVYVCGICGSDLHAYKGASPDIIPPIVLGHEFAGVVARIGEGVSHLRVGDRVTVEPLITCGHCPYCLAGQENRCVAIKVLGCQSDGAFAEYIAVNAGRAYKLPEDISFEEGALVEPLAVAVHAVNRAKLQEGDVKSAVVFGVGAVGNSVVQVLKIMGVPMVIAVDVLDWRLALAKRCGADILVNARLEDVCKRVLDATKGLGADVCFEVAGHELALNQALEITRKGGRIALIGLYEEPMVKTTLANITFKELVVLGSAVYTQADFLTAVNLLQHKYVNARSLITHIFPLEEAAKAFELLTSGNEPACKVLLRVCEEVNNDRKISLRR